MLKKPAATFHYNRPISQEEQKRVVHIQNEKFELHKLSLRLLDIEAIAFLFIL